MAPPMARAAWWALLVVAVLWRAPSLLSALAALLLDRARFRAVSALAGVLRAAGARGAARWVLEHELRRCRRRMAALAERRQRCPHAEDALW